MGKKGKGGTKTYGRSKKKPSAVRYVSENRRFKNKVKRVRQSNGEKASIAYMKDYPNGRSSFTRRAR